MDSSRALADPEEGNSIMEVLRVGLVDSSTTAAEEDLGEFGEVLSEKRM